MNKATFLAHCDAVGGTGNWQVFCPRCAFDIGTMSIDALNKAIHSTALRGGVLCPACRERSCRRCGEEIEGFSTGQPPELCVFCGFEHAERLAEKDCRHRFRETPFFFQEQLGTCPLCELEIAVGRLSEEQVVCLSSISYLKPMSENGEEEIWKHTGGGEFEKPLTMKIRAWLTANGVRLTASGGDSENSLREVDPEQREISLEQWKAGGAKIHREISLLEFVEAGKEGGGDA